MQINRGKMFLTLYKKEMRELAAEIIITVSAVVVTSVLLYFNMKGTVGLLAVPFFMVAGLAGLVPVLSSFRLLGKEWANNTVYLMMSLPVKGGMILGSKFLALITQYFLGTGTVLLAGVFLTIASVPDALQQIQVYYEQIPWEVGIYGYIFTIVLLAYLLSMSFFSQMVGKLVQRFNGFLTGVTFLGIWWLSDKLLKEAGTIHLLQSIGLLDTGLIWTCMVAYAAASLAIFLLAVLVYNRKVEL